MLAFLETSLKLDASGLSIGSGSNNTLVASLTIDQRSTPFALTSFTATVPANFDATVPYTLTVTKINTQLCTLTITFAQPVANVRFDEVRTITIHGSNGDTYTLSLEVNYANAFVGTNWANSAESLSIDDIDLRGPLTSNSLNNRLRGLLHSSITGLNQVRNYIKYYYYKEKYLNDIIDFAIMAGSGIESSSTAVVFDTNGNITSLITTYGSRYVRVLYTYGNYALNRLAGVDQNTPLTTETVSLLNSFTVQVVDAATVGANVIYTLGVVTITRNLSQVNYSIPYLADYNNALPSSDPNNKLSNFKYYRTYTMTGWVVVA